MSRANYADASKQSKDKYTDLSSQPFDVLVPQCLLCHNLWISMEQLKSVAVLRVSLYKSDNYSMTVSIQLLPSAIICLVLYRLSKALGKPNTLTFGCQFSSYKTANLCWTLNDYTLAECLMSLSLHQSSLF